MFPAENGTSLHLQHLSVKQGISSGVIGEFLVISKKTIIVLNPSTLVAVMPRPGELVIVHAK